MKTNKLITIIFSLVCVICTAQEIERIEVIGKINVDRNDVEGVTVYNHTSKSGTVTDKDGKFTIAVALNDKVEFGALQFKNFTVTITQEILDSREMSVHLIEDVNRLPEVVVFPYGLTGNLEEDVANTELVNPNLDALYFGLNNLDKIEFLPDHLTGVRNTAMEESRLVNGVNMIDVVGLALEKLFKPKDIEPYVPVYERKSILDVYSIEDLKDVLNIVEKDLTEFVYYVEENNFDLALLNPERELDFYIHLYQMEKQFLNLKDDRN